MLILLARCLPRHHSPPRPSRCSRKRIRRYSRCVIHDAKHMRCCAPRKREKIRAAPRHAAADVAATAARRLLFVILLMFAPRRCRRFICASRESYRGTTMIERCGCTAETGAVSAQKEKKKRAWSLMRAACARSMLFYAAGDVFRPRSTDVHMIREPPGTRTYPSEPAFHRDPPGSSS